MLAERFPLIREVRRAAGAARAIRLTLAVASLASAARVEMSAALLAAQALSDDSDPRRRGALTAAVAGGRAQHRLICELASLCPHALIAEWNWSQTQCDKLSSQLRLLVGWGPLLVAPLASAAPRDTAGWRREDRLPSGVGLFLAA